MVQGTNIRTVIQGILCSSNIFPREWSRRPTTGPEMKGEKNISGNGSASSGKNVTGHDFYETLSSLYIDTCTARAAAGRLYSSRQTML
jgi:hypothetical protein